MTADQTITYSTSREADEHLGESDAYLVVALEPSRPLEPPRRIGLAAVDRIEVGRGAAYSQRRDAARGIRIDVPDALLSGTHLRIHRSGLDWLIEDAGSKNGTVVDGEPVPRAVVRDGSVIEAGGVMLVFRAPTAVALPMAAIRAENPPASFATMSPRLERAFWQLDAIARSGVPVLLRGETGTGKELTARAVHDRSGRTGPLVAINCGAIPRTLIESELFGHRRGAFTGAADDQPGLVRAADHGTLFLDEIGELAETSQVALLRVLQEGEVLPVGAHRPIKVDVRVVAATHQDLAAGIERGRFRQDLYARLAGFQMTLPPLRERREDLGMLIAHFLRKHAGDRVGKLRIQRAAARALFLYRWPLNVRELENAIAAALALCSGDEILSAHLPEAMQWVLHERARHADDPDLALRERLTTLLTHHRGNLTAVGREMGKDRVQIRRWCKRFAIDAETFRKR